MHCREKHLKGFVNNTETGSGGTENTEMKRYFLDAYTNPQGIKQSTLCFPVWKLYLRDMNRNGVWLTSDCPAKLVQQKESKRSALPLCECCHVYSSFNCKSSAKEVHQEQSGGNLLQQPCTPGHAAEEAWNEGEREKEDQTELWHVMVSAYYSDWQYRIT